MDQLELLSAREDDGIGLLVFPVDLPVIFLCCKFSVVGSVPHFLGSCHVAIFSGSGVLGWEPVGKRHLWISNVRLIFLYASVNNLMMTWIAASNHRHSTALTAYGCWIDLDPDSRVAWRW